MSVFEASVCFMGVVFGLCVLVWCVQEASAWLRVRRLRRKLVKLRDLISADPDAFRDIDRTPTDDGIGHGQR